MSFSYPARFAGLHAVVCHMIAVVGGVYEEGVVQEIESGETVDDAGDHFINNSESLQAVEIVEAAYLRVVKQRELRDLAGSAWLRRSRMLDPMRFVGDLLRKKRTAFGLKFRLRGILAPVYGF